MGMRTNPFAPLYHLQNTGTAEEKHANLPDFPRIIDVELTNSCNFRCLMCPTGNHSQTRPLGFMNPNLIWHMAEEAKEYGTAFRFIGWGEPTLHPELAFFISACTNRGLLSHLNTNGSKITETMAQRLVWEGLSSIKFSFQGVDQKSYAEMRNIDYFEPLLEKIELMRNARERENSDGPYIHVSTTTTYETPEQIEAFRKRVEPLCDGLSIGKTVFDFMDWKAARLRPHEKEMLQRLAGMETADKRHPDPCPEVFDKLSVHWNGWASVCCNDFDNKAMAGHFPQQTIKEIWRSPMMEEYRERLSRKEYSGPLCTNCYDYMGLTAA